MVGTHTQFAIVPSKCKYASCPLHRVSPVSLACCPAEAARRAWPARISPMPDLTILQTIPLFRELSDAELEALGTLLVERRFPKGSDIVRVDEPGDTFYV